MMIRDSSFSFHLVKKTTVLWCVETRQKKFVPSFKIPKKSRFF